MAALADITRNAPSKAFSTIFASKLLTLDAAIKSLESEILRLRDFTNPDKYIELNGKTGIFKSSEYNPDIPDGQREGFMLDSNGEAEFNNLKLRGNLDARISFSEGNILPIYGAVRAYAYFEVDGNDVFVNYKSGNISDIVYISPGTYSIRINDTITWGTVIGEATNNYGGYFKITRDRTTFDSTGSSTVINIRDQDNNSIVNLGGYVYGEVLFVLIG